MFTCTKTRKKRHLYISTYFLLLRDGLFSAPGSSVRLVAVSPPFLCRAHFRRLLWIVACVVLSPCRHLSHAASTSLSGSGLKQKISGIGKPWWIPCLNLHGGDLDVACYAEIEARKLSRWVTCSMTVFSRTCMAMVGEIWMTITSLQIFVSTGKPYSTQR